MKHSIVVMAMIKYPTQLCVHLLDKDADWDKREPEEKLANIVKAGHYVQLSPILEIEYEPRKAEDTVAESLTGLDEQERVLRERFQEELEPLNRRRRELRQLTFQSAPGQEFIPSNVGGDQPARSTEDAMDVLGEEVIVASCDLSRSNSPDDDIPF